MRMNTPVVVSSLSNNSNKTSSTSVVVLPKETTTMTETSSFSDSFSKFQNGGAAKTTSEKEKTVSSRTVETQEEVTEEDDDGDESTKETAAATETLSNEETVEVVAAEENESFRDTEAVGVETAATDNPASPASGENDPNSAAKIKNLDPADDALLDTEASKSKVKLKNDENVESFSRQATVTLDAPTETGTAELEGAPELDAGGKPEDANEKSASEVDLVAEDKVSEQSPSISDDDGSVIAEIFPVEKSNAKGEESFEHTTEKNAAEVVEDDRDTALLPASNAPEDSDDCLTNEEVESSGISSDIENADEDTSDENDDIADDEGEFTPLPFESPFESTINSPGKPTTKPSYRTPMAGSKSPPASAATNTTTSLTLCIPPLAAIKVIKGEIHNVLTIMRADHRYVSRLRFTEELLAGDDDDDDEYPHAAASSTTPSWQHPVAQALQDLHADLTAAVERGAMDAVLQHSDYLEPFCQAIQKRDISATVTGTALASLHKFILYGFVSYSSTTTSRSAVNQNMMRIAHALLHCTFEETGGGDTRAGSAGGNTRSVSTSSTGSVPLSTPSANTPIRSGSGNQGAGSTPGSAGPTATTLSAVPYDDEQTVLKLLDVAALLVRTSFQDEAALHLIEAKTVVRLLNTCLHVSHRAEKASPLLKSAASSALSQIVLQVFAGPGHPPVMQARREILAKLASLLNPTLSDEDVELAAAAALAANNREGSLRASLVARASISVRHHHKALTHHVPAAPNPMVVANALSLVNIALETCREPLTPEEIAILQNDVCKYLLQWSSTTHDLMLLSLTLRVIFNLFQSIRNHLKVPLEVFLTSVHLRILRSPVAQYSPEEREVALESLLEFCQEPSLMQDIFLNYDCDVACTNLYESIVSALGEAATPVGWEAGAKTHKAEFDDVEDVDDEEGDSEQKQEQNPDANDRSSAPQPELVEDKKKKKKQKGSIGDEDESEARHIPPVTHLQRLGMDGLLAVLDSIAKRCQEMRRSNANSRTSSTESLGFLSDAAEAPRSGISSDSADKTLIRELAPENLHERKRRKHALVKVSRSFNAGPMNDAWLKLAVKEGVLESETSVDGVAEILYTASGVDKVKVGIYLSKGPDKDYPFNVAVRQAFVARYNFRNLTFAGALRQFLSKFRLPGEAQCIDRFMEAFSGELYKQQGEKSFFKNADAVYVLAFSTIMLNTDLHNPTIKEDRRMTKDQFIRNNRGINGGEDMPSDFLSELYDQIKDKQIEVRKELGEFMKKHEHEDFRTVWDNMLSKQGEVATAFFTPAGMARSTSNLAGFHDKEMFVSLAKHAVQAFAGIFQRSWDDTLVVRALGGLKTLARVAAYLDCDSKVDEVLQVLLPQGRDYIMNSIAADLHFVGGPASVVTDSSVASAEDDETTHHDEMDHPIPYGLLCSNVSDEAIDISGSAAHRGLLAMDCGFVLMRKYSHRVTIAWPDFFGCLCALRDAHALPPGLSDLDDFADSNGNILPLSSFAKMSQKRMDDFFRAQAETETEEERKGWFRSFFRKKSHESEEMHDEAGLAVQKRELSALGKTLLAVAEAADVEKVAQQNSPDNSVTEQKINRLLGSLDGFPFKRAPVGEQHAIFSLELATRALLSNREQATELFLPFLAKFENILGMVSAKKVPAPFVIERIVVTILRCCIHLYEIEELRPHLRAALHLFLISLPKSFIRVIADRMACGLAIILRSSFHFFESHGDWTLMGDTLDMLAHYRVSRVFVFDGIASTVEYALPDIEGEMEDEEARPVLSKEACGALSRLLIRFVLGFYQNDVSLSVPAMLCLEKIYRHSVELLLAKDGKERADAGNIVPDKDFWQNIAVAIYSVCRSPDAELSNQGAKSFGRVIIPTSVEEIPDDKWTDVLFLMANKQPPVVADISRGNTFSVLGDLMCHVLPRLSHNMELRDDLVDLVQQVAQLAQENLRQGRRGSVSPLFEKTVQTVTSLSNNMTTEEWTGEAEFSTWASETLLAELERVGAAGAVLQNQIAVQAKYSAPASPKLSDKS